MNSLGSEPTRLDSAAIGLLVTYAKKNSELFASVKVLTQNQESSLLE